MYCSACADDDDSAPTSTSGSSDVDGGSWVDGGGGETEPKAAMAEEHDGGATQTHFDPVTCTARGRGQHVVRVGSAQTAQERARTHRSNSTTDQYERRSSSLPALTTH